MDGNRFDELTRALTTGASRRTLLRRLAGGAAGGLLAHLGMREGAAQQCRQPGKLCNKNANCCSGLCDTTNPDPFKRNRCLCPNGVPPVNGSCGVVSGTCDGAINGTQCNDNNPCTTNDTCLNGVCVGTPVVCRPQSQCHLAGTCNPRPGSARTRRSERHRSATTATSAPPARRCQAGQCVGGTPVVCPAQPVPRTRGSATRARASAPTPEQGPRDALQRRQRLHARTTSARRRQLRGGTPVVCTASDQCHDAGTCNPATGVCSNPAKPNGTACNDGNACTQTDTCQAGVCTGSNPVVCTGPDQCHERRAPATRRPASAPARRPRPTAPPATTATPARRPTPARRGLRRPGPGRLPRQPVPRTPAPATRRTGACSNPTNKPNGTALQRRQRLHHGRYLPERAVRRDAGRLHAKRPVPRRRRL